VRDPDTFSLPVPAWMGGAQLLEREEPMSSKVKPVPDGYHVLTAYLIVNGADKAIEFYKKAFGAIELFRLGGSDGRVGHAELLIGDSHLMLADEFPEMGARSPQTIGGSPVRVLIYVEKVDEVVARAVAAGAKLVRPVEDQFYGDRAGGIEDPFGHHWHVATHIEDVSPEEMKKRGAEMAAKHKKDPAA
jgi:PhnB protein